MKPKYWRILLNSRSKLTLGTALRTVIVTFASLLWLILCISVRVQRVRLDLDLLSINVDVIMIFLLLRKSRRSVSQLFGRSKLYESGTKADLKSMRWKGRQRTLTAKLRAFKVMMMERRFIETDRIEHLLPLVR